MTSSKLGAHLSPDLCYPCTLERAWNWLRPWNFKESQRLRWAGRRWRDA